MPKEGFLAWFLAQRVQSHSTILDSIYIYVFKILARILLGTHKKKESYHIRTAIKVSRGCVPARPSEACKRVVLGRPTNQ